MAQPLPVVPPLTGRARPSLRFRTAAVLACLACAPAGCGSGTTPARGAGAGVAAVASGALPSTGPGPAPIVYRPPGLSRARAVPLVIALHATGGTPATFRLTTGLDAV